MEWSVLGVEIELNPNRLCKHARKANPSGAGTEQCAGRQGCKRRPALHFDWQVQPGSRNMFRAGTEGALLRTSKFQAPPTHGVAGPSRSIIAPTVAATKVWLKVHLGGASPS